MKKILMAVTLLALMGCNANKNQKVSLTDMSAPENETESVENGEEEIARDPVVLDENNFPDKRFRGALCMLLPIADGDIIPYEFLDEVDELDLCGLGISSLKGIEHFKALEQLDCSSNQIITCDLSQNTELRVLVCEKNKLTSLDLSNNEKLQQLNCQDNRLTALDVTFQEDLTHLICDNNELGQIDVSHNTKLVKLSCNDCELTVLDVSSNPNLVDLYCNGNKFKELNLTNNTKLENLYCEKPLFRSLDIAYPPNKPDLGKGSQTRTGLTLIWHKKHYKMPKR